MTRLDRRTLDRLVEAISYEIQQVMREQGYSLTLPHSNPESDSCIDCLGQCVQTCPHKIRLAIQAGAERFSARPGLGPVSPEIAPLIDHTLLEPEAAVQQITQLCHEALLHKFAAVCLNPTQVRLAAHLLQNRAVKICAVVGFPLGATSTPVKVFETEQALTEGATEIDLVINIGALKGGDDELVRQDIAAVVHAAHQRGALCKVVLETALLSDSEKVRACRLAQRAGADFVKTSTGFGRGGTTIEDVELMRQTVGPTSGVKASGVRNLTKAQNMRGAGATPLGTGVGIRIGGEAQSA